MKIKSIKRVNSKDIHYDITVEKNHNFFANGILTHNCNLPARNVVIVGTTRGINDIDELEIVQECGRAGRPQYDDKGNAYLLVPEGGVSFWKNKVENPRPVLSVMNNHHTLAFHAIAEIQNREIKDAQSLFKWYSRSLASHQEMPFTMEEAEALFQDLLNMEMITQHGSYVNVTKLGMICSWLYYDPWTIYSWFKNFGKVFDITNGDDNKLDDLLLAWAMGAEPSSDMGYIPKDILDECEDIRWKLRNRGIYISTTAPAVLAYYQMLQGADINGPVAPLARAIRYDIRRINQALIMIDSMYAKWGTDLWKILPDRIIYGIPAEMAELVKLPGIGGKRARSMWDIGIRSIEAVADSKNKKKIYTILGVKIAKTAIEAAKETA